MCSNSAAVRKLWRQRSNVGRKSKRSYSWSTNGSSVAAKYGSNRDWSGSPVPHEVAQLSVQCNDSQACSAGCGSSRY